MSKENQDKNAVNVSLLPDFSCRGPCAHKPILTSMQ